MNIKDYQAYPATFTPDGAGGFNVRIHHSNEGQEGWNTCGKTWQEAGEMAVQCIMDAAAADAGRHEIPHTVQAAPGDVLIALPADVALKIMLRNVMFAGGMSVSDLARKTGRRPQAVFKILDFAKSSRLSTLAPLFAAAGRPLNISC